MQLNSMWHLSGPGKWLALTFVVIANLGNGQRISAPSPSVTFEQYRRRTRLTPTDAWYLDDGADDPSSPVQYAPLDTFSLLPRYDAMEAEYVQVPGVEGDLIFSIGGFSDTYDGDTQMIQVFDGARNTWLKEEGDIHRMPPAFGTTHFGHAIDAPNRLLYVVSGQNGPGCSLATRGVFAWKWPAVCNSIDGCATSEARVIALQQLPVGEERFSPSVFLVTKQQSPGQPLSHSLHVVAGMQSPSRLDPSTSHLRLDFTLDAAADAIPQLLGNSSAANWVSLPPSPPTGIHGTYFQNAGSFYMLAFCETDLIATQGETMHACNQKAFSVNFRESHVPTGKMVKYTLATKSWEVLPQPPALPPSCQVVTLELPGGVLVFVGGVSSFKINKDNVLKKKERKKEAATRRRVRAGLDQRPQAVHVYLEEDPAHAYRGIRISTVETQKDTVATLDLKTMVWNSVPFPYLEKNTRNAMSWVDSRNVLRVMRPTEWHTLGATQPRPPNFQSILLVPAGTMASKIIANPESARFEECLLQRECSGEGGLCLALDGLKRVYPEDGRYDTLRSSWNKAALDFQKTNAVVVVKSEEQTVLSMRCATSVGLRVCVRGGRHDYEGASTCGPGGITIDVRKLMKFEFDSDTDVATFGAGTTLGAANVLLNAVGGVLPSGHCASVGLPGITLVGGHGLFSRRFGLTSDRLVSMRYVDAFGKLQIANSKQNEEMFWLARGGGAGGDAYPGVITELAFKIVPNAELFREVPKLNQHGKPFKMELSEAAWKEQYYIWNIYLDTSDPATRVDDVACLFYTWQLWGPESSNARLTAEAWIVTGMKGSSKKYTTLEPRAFLHGMYHGYKSIFVNSVQKRFFRLLGQECPALAASGKVSAFTIERTVTNYLHYARYLAGTPALTDEQMMAGESGYDTKPPYNHWKGRSLVSYKRVSVDFMKNLASLFFTGPYAKGERRAYVELKPLGGVISNVTVAPDTAFGHRNGLFWMLVNHFWTATTPASVRRGICQASYDYIAKLHALTGETSTYMYAGYADHSMFRTDKDELTGYFGQKNAGRVHALVKKHDPEKRFTRLKDLRARRAWVCADE